MLLSPDSFLGKYVAPFFFVKEEAVGKVEATSTAKMGITNTKEQALPVPKDLLYQKPQRTPTKKLRVVAIGAGYAGLTLAHKVYHEHKLTDIMDLVIYEKNQDVGGTWLVNKYPGISCDIPAHLYTFAFEPNPDWRAFYATGDEIFSYVKRTVDKYNLARDVKFSHQVIHAEFNEQEGQWHIKVRSDNIVLEDTCDILISGTGQLSQWDWPDIPGLHSFQGNLVHTARWNHDYDYTDKRIAVIGNGSSAIQVVPEMAKIASQVTNFFRTRQWITPGLANSAIKGEVNYEYTEEEKKRFREDAEALKQHRRKLQHELNASFAVLEKGSNLQKIARERMKMLMLHRLNGNEEIANKIIPDFELGCRRTAPGPGYLESFNLPHVALVSDSIQEVTPTGIKTATGEFHEFDVIICATGFDVSFRPVFPVLGRERLNLAEQWKDEPEAYLSLCAPGFPNYFMFNGPNATVGHGSLLLGLNWSAEWMVKWMKKMAEENIKWIDVDPEVTAEYNAYSQEILKTFVWSGGCRSWFKNNRLNGRVTAVWAGSALSYKEMVDEIRPEDFTIKYRNANRFRFMGNGRTQREARGEDLAFFIDK